MIPAFEFSGVGRIVFGRGKFALAGELAAGLGRAALVIFNGGGAERASHRNRDQSRCGGVSLAAARGADRRARLTKPWKKRACQHCDCVIGIGGGSAIDAAKAVAGLLTNGGSAVDYMEVVGKGKKIARLAAPWMAIPTTAGTGAEATRNAVIGSPEKRFKASIRSELLLPRDGAGRSLSRRHRPARDHRQFRNGCPLPTDRIVYFNGRIADDRRPGDCREFQSPSAAFPRPTTMAWTSTPARAWPSPRSSAA